VRRASWSDGGPGGFSEARSTKHEARLTIAIFVVLAAASVAPIWSNDYFWQSAAGSWILAHHALPATDPLAVASSREPWIDGEWLFQLLAAVTEELGGIAAINAVRALAVAAFFTWIFVRLSRTISPFTAAFVTFFAWYGALPWLRERPAAIAAMVIALVIALPRSVPVVVIATALLVNIHPSALLLPVIVAILDRRLTTTAASAAALLVNPYGLTAITNPFHVTRLATLALFRNEEWVPTSLNEFRFYAVALIAVVLVLVTSARRAGWISSTVALLFFTALSLRYARNQTIFYCTAPLLLEPHLKSIPDRFRKLLLIPAVITLASIVATSPFRGGIDATNFPVAATARVRAAGLQGNIFSGYGMGGFLEWAFLPERRVLNDGRNELFVEFQKRVDAARSDPAAWQRFVDDYKIRVAFIERRDAAAWREYFRAPEWQVVAADRAAVVLARR
jgi:hypothetical protein